MMNRFPALCCSLVFALLLSVGPLAAQTYGEGPIVTRELDLEPFSAIGLGVEGKIYLTPGPDQRVAVEGQANVIEALKREVEGSSWDIAFDGRVRDYEPLVIRITLPMVRELAVGGSGEIATSAPFEDLSDLQFSIGGNGTITFAGSAERLEVNIGGSGTVRAEALAVEHGQVSIGGSGEAFVHATESLDVSIAGSGEVVYTGNPQVSSSIVGGGEVRSQ